MNKISQNNNSTMVLFLLFLFAVILLRSAWITEDAYITLRTVDNFINGYGLTWNVSERVQVYTHPMWMFMLSGIYFFTKESFYTTLFLNISISLITFLLVAKSTIKKGIGAYIGLSILFFSKAFIDFSTSGLENPLTHLLLANFVLIFLSKNEKPNNRQVFLLSLFAALAAFNRTDTFLYYLPALCYILWLRRDWQTVKRMFFGLIPFLIWELFSIYYYGFFFPNTAYAKLGINLPQIELFEYGYLYFINSLHWDPITLFTIGISLSLVALRGSANERMIGLGVFLYLLYLLWIGGDFMSGRFFSSALLVAVILLSHEFSSLRLLEGSIVFIFVIIMGFVSPTPTITSINDETLSTGRLDVNNIADERSFYYQQSNLLYDRQNMIQPYHEWVFDGKKISRQNKKVYELINVGFVGFFAGPEVFIIDTLGLTDPLLARLPPIKLTEWRPGHFERTIPAGYYCSVKNNDNCIYDPEIAAYYEKIRMITRGKLWSFERFKTIWEINTGKYNYLLENYRPEEET